MQVIIRPLKIEDAYVSVKWRNDKEVFKYTGNTYNKEITIENELEWITKVIAKNNLGQEYRCAILVDGLYIGNIYLTDICKGSAIYHIFIGEKKYWGTGVAYYASQLILNYAFSELSLEKVILKVKVANERAYYLYKKLGFEEIESDKEWITMKVCSNS